jgi:WD40 repeat protein
MFNLRKYLAVFVALALFGYVLVSCSGIRLYHAKLMGRFYRPVLTMCLANNGSILVTDDRAGNVELWNLATDRPTPLNVNAGFGDAITVSSDGDFLAGINEQYVKIIDLRKRKNLYNLHVCNRGSSADCFVPNTHILAVGIFSSIVQPTVGMPPGNAVEFWDISHKKLLRRVKLPYRVLKIVSSPEGSEIAVGSYGCYVISPTNKIKTQIYCRNEDAVDMAFSPDSERLAIGTDNGTCQIVDLSGRRPPISWSAGGPIYAVAYDPTGDLIATASFGSTVVSLWDTATGHLRGRYYAGGIQTVTLVFSKDGKYLYSTAGDKTLDKCNVSSVVNTN